MTPRIESLLAARLFLAPQTVGDRIFFLSNMSGRLSLYAMDAGGSVPEPLLPPQIALQNPDLIEGYPFYVFPALGTILVTLDRDGDERYQPMAIPIDGGFPEPVLDPSFADARVRMLHCDRERNLVYLHVESLTEQRQDAYRLRLADGTLEHLARSAWGAYVAGVSEDHRRAILLDAYTMGDLVAYLWEEGAAERRLVHGVPLEERAPDQRVPPSGLGACWFTGDGRNVLCIAAVFSDTYGLALLPLDGSQHLLEVSISGAAHTGAGELVSLEHLRDDRYLVGYNIDGASWLYEGRFDEARLSMQLDRVICGVGALRDGVLESVFYDKEADRYALAFSTATSPTQIYTVARADHTQMGIPGTRWSPGSTGETPALPAHEYQARADHIQVVQHTRERILGIPADLLSAGEDASFISHDGLRVSARLYLPAASLGFDGPRPLVYYVHGGPQGQERPDFAWFSMPLIQFLTLNGFAVFVPNARGSTGYGLAYTKHVDHDWGGQDRLDHVHAMTRVLPRDPRLDTRRAGVVGRSYGGYMTLTLATRHPDLWSAAVDMFGPYDLFQFMDTVPETWRAYFKLAIGDPEQDRDFLTERSPRTYIDDLRCPLLVIQGQNDPRVVEAESRAVVEGLRAAGKDVSYLLFENEGHDVLKFENRVTCYNAIAEFFRRHL